MRPILILTKNLLIEQQLQNQLQHLNYEVLCSVELLNQLKLSVQTMSDNADNQRSFQKNLLINYQAIILSETISDNEIQELVPSIQLTKQVLLRKLVEEPAKKEKERLRDLGIYDWILVDNSINSLREQLSEKLSAYQGEESSIIFLYQDEGLSSDVTQLKRNLSKREKATLECLSNSKGKVVSREDLCTYIWNEAPSNSRLSQTSMLIRKIKEKMGKYGFKEEAIQTIWGEGYLLSKDLSDSSLLANM
ncbi:winged helix-turn-helix domain-containing protein [Enterococcus hulanensis]|uniref:winged helix-turn-helix domain-containing protein n=1 Tax=Enterococcus hulanensis TaxID=2559929 RepID=UPI001A8C692C|nr:helix-turn-helix domain-containing protein [Enterococcus hulanensis]MBO0457186.1 winged helix-turn-helix domain-containing protein [Enterococcus hulanensis]